jgi:hypothetical protein
VGLGLEEKEKGSFGHANAALEGLNVGAEKAAAFVVDGYTGTINSESVAVGNMPTAFLALTAELAAAGLPGDKLELELELLLWCRDARTPAATAPATTRTATGIPNLIHGLRGFFALEGVM